VDAGTLIAEVAKRDGILLDRNDPVIVMATAVDVAMEKRSQEMDTIVTRFETTVASATPALNDEQVEKIGNRIAWETNFLIGRRTAQFGAAMGAAVLGIGLLVGGAAGWWFFERQNDTELAWGKAAISQCHDAAIVNGVCQLKMMR
jgi:hypothetical protein